MPIRGETIGRAYVKIFADGTDFGDSIRESMRDEDDAFKQMGKRQSEAYSEGWDEQIESINNKLVKGLEAGARRNRGRFDAVGEQIGSDLFAPIDKQFREAFGPEVGKRMSRDMREAFFMSGGASDVLDEFVEHWEANWVKATNSIDREVEQMVRAQEAHLHHLTVVEDEESRARMKIRQEEFLAAIQRIEKQGEVEAEAHRENETHRAEATRSVNRLRRSFDRLVPAIDRGNKKMDVFADGVARAFGKGARNDFLNLAGRMVGFFVRLPLLIPKAISGLAQFGAKLVKTFGEEGFSGLVKMAMSTLAQGLVGIIGVAVIGGLVAAAVGIVASAVMSLVGTAVAAIGSLVFAASGAMLILGGLMVPFAAAIGVGVLAIKNMDEDTKKHFKSIKDSFTDLGKEASKNIFGDLDFSALERVVESLGRITGPISKSLGTMLDGLIDDLDSPAFRGFEDKMGKILPPMVESLGAIFENLGRIVGNVFLAISPSVQETLDWLVKITDQFADWTGSAEGKTSIENFMDRAKASLKSIGGFLNEAIGLMGDLFGVGQGTGDNVFDSLAGKIEGWREKLKEAKKDGTLQKWFDDAKDTADQIGEMVEELGIFLDRLDTPENRKLVRDLADAFIEVVDAIGQVYAAFRLMGSVFKGVYNALIGPALSQMLHGVSNLLDSLGDMFDVLGSIPGAPAWIGKTADGLHTAADKADGLADSIRKIPDKHQTDINVATNEAAIAQIGWQLDYVARPRTAHISVLYHPHVVNPSGPVTGMEGDPPPGGGNNGSGRMVVSQTGRTLNMGGITIVTPTADPYAVAAETVNRMAALAYV